FSTVARLILSMDTRQTSRLNAEAAKDAKNDSSFLAFAAFAFHGGVSQSNTLPAARGETPAAFGRRCIPADCVAPPSNIPDILGRRALSAGCLAALGATPDFHHGLLAASSAV